MRSHRSDSWDVRRLGVLLLAALQLGAAGVQGLDAVMDAGQTTLPVHVESHGSEDCEVQHDHLFCQVVRSLGAVAQRTAGPGITDLQDAIAYRLPTTEVAVLPAGHSDGASRPRAPPVA